MIDNDEIKKGQVVVFTNGCYSDYALQDVFVAIADFNYKKEAGVFKQTIDPDNDYVHENTESFITFLIKNNKIILCNWFNIHTGDYRFFDGISLE